MQKGCCFYCGNRFNKLIHKNGYQVFQPQIDHVLPFSYSFNDDFDNLVLACQICNRIKADYIFDTIEQAMTYVRKKASDRIKVQRVFGCIRSQKEVAKVLLSEMPKHVVLEGASNYKNYTTEQLEARLEELKLLQKIYC